MKIMYDHLGLHVKDLAAGSYSLVATITQNGAAKGAVMSVIRR